MKILLVNKFSGLEGEVGGATRYILELFDLLKSHGHEVAFFSMLPPKSSTVVGERFEKWKEYWVTNVHTKTVRLGWQGIRTALRSLWSLEAAQNLRQFIKDFKPDLIHLNSFSLQISPSILPVIKKSGIPAVMTVHDYELVYPDFSLKADQWEDFLKKRFFEIVRNRRIKDSFIASSLKWFQFILHRRIGVYRFIDCFLCPSRFMEECLHRDGFSSTSFLMNWNAHPAKGEDTQFQPRDTFLFFGRMTPEKGVRELLEAYRQALEKEPRLPKLVMVGNGMEREIHEFFTKHALGEKISHAPFTGIEPEDEYERARVVIIPSFPYLENFPYAVMNAFSHQLPVITSGLGGLAEMVDGSGWNVLGQTEQVSREVYIRRLSQTLLEAAHTQDEELECKGERGYEYVSRLTSEWYYGEIMKVYRALCAKKYY